VPKQGNRPDQTPEEKIARQQEALTEDAGIGAAVEVDIAEKQKI